MTSVEVFEVRDVIGTGPSIESIKFPVFHVFDANWRLKMVADYSEDVNGHLITFKLRHKRRDSDDLWNLEANVGFRVEEDGFQADLMFDWRFSNRKRGVDVLGGVWKSKNGEKEEMNVKVTVFMQVKNSMGIQLRNFIDFSRPLPIFSDGIVKVAGHTFHVNRMTLSMASPVFFRAFLESLEKGKIEILESEISNPKDFRRILNLIYPPHLVPKQWIQEVDTGKQLEHVYRILQISKNLQIGLIFEKVDEWIQKYGRFELGSAILLAQTFGLRRLMGSKIAEIRSIDQISRSADFHLFSKKTKAMILDHILSI